MALFEAPTQTLSLRLGVKTDPIEYRYSYDWLFRILADEGVAHLQLGTFFELYQLPDDFFRRLTHKAAEFHIEISSLFTSHRELGGFFHADPSWHRIARHNYERLIEIGALVAARSVGSNPGAVLRDHPEIKGDGLRRYLDTMQDLMGYAARLGLEALTIEPMSCLAEPPTLPDEIQSMADELLAYNRQHSDATVPVGYCADISHGYADSNKVIQWNNVQLFQACLPYLQELHLRNTDALFDKTFGFSAEERERGIVDVPALRDLLVTSAGQIPRQELVGYFEIGGPKLGRDYSDGLLEANLRESLRYLKETFETETPTSVKHTDRERPFFLSEQPDLNGIQIAPSMMCADIVALGADLKRLEAAGVDLLHFDLMDGHYVPNMPLGLGVLEQLRPLTDLPFDVHLMVEDNDFFIARLLEIGVQQISVHAESATHLDRTLSLIRAAGVKAGVALNPSTPLSTLDYCLEQLDFVLLMTVNPGFASQKRVPSALRKIADCRAYLQARGLDILIEVDGNVSFEGIPEMVAAGAKILVAGTSSLFHKSASYGVNARRTRQAIAEGLKQREVCV